MRQKTNLSLNWGRHHFVWLQHRPSGSQVSATILGVAKGHGRQRNLRLLGYPMFFFVIFGGFHKKGYPKMVGLSHGKPRENGWFRGTPISGNHHIWWYTYFFAPCWGGKSSLFVVHRIKKVRPPKVFPAQQETPNTWWKLITLIHEALFVGGALSNPKMAAANCGLGYSSLSSETLEDCLGKFILFKFFIVFLVLVFVP